MAQVDDNGHDTAKPGGAERAPSFDPRCAFAWTLRSAEIVRRERGETSKPSDSVRSITAGAAAA